MMKKVVDERDEKITKLQAEVERLTTLLTTAAPFIRLVLHSTEARYDDPNSEYYDDGAQYEVINECRNLLTAIDADMGEDND